MSYPCPFCRTPADLTSGCPGCRRGPDPDAALVIRLNGEIAALTGRLRDLSDQRNAAAARVRARLAEPLPSATPPPAAAAAPARSAAPARPEASTRLVQTVLFSLGGLLLAVAAIVFTAVAWSQFGVRGRAALLAAVTVVLLAVPPLALRRGLRGTAETFAAVGLLLVLLDGYAAWYVDLFGLRSAWGYAGAVCAVTAAVAAGYQHFTGLTGPRYAALLVAQPVLPLIVAPLAPDPTGWAYTLAAVAALDLAVVHFRRGASTGVGITAYGLGLLWVVGAGLSALTGLAVAVAAGPAALAGTGLVTAALIGLAGALRSGIRMAAHVAGGVLVVAAGVAAGRVVALADLPGVPVVLVAAALAVAVTLLPAGWRRGPVIGAWLVTGAAGMAVLAAVAEAALGTAAAAHGAAELPVDRQLPVAVVLLGVAVTVLAPAGSRPVVAAGAAGLLAYAGPVGFGLPWWSAVVLDLMVAALALGLAIRVPPSPARTAPGADRSPVWACAIAVLLAGHAVVVGYGRPALAALTLGGVLLLGLGAAAAARTTARAADVGAASLVVGLLAAPAAAWSATAALPDAWPARAALLTVLLVVAAARLLSGGYRGPARTAALLALVVVPLLPLGTADSPAVYAGLALLAAATTVQFGRTAAGLVAVPLATGLVAGAADSLAAVLIAPYRWLEHVWAGPGAIRPVAADRGDVLALVLLAGAAAVAVGLDRWADLAAAAGRGPVAVRSGWAAAPALLLALPMAAAAWGAPWPSVPAAALMAGLAGLLAVAVRPRVTSGTGRLGAAGAGPLLAAAVCTALVGAGLAGALATRIATLAALAATVVAGAAAGAAGRTPVARLIGGVGAVAAAAALAFAAGQAAGWAQRETAPAVLAVAALALAAGAALPAVRGRTAPRGLSTDPAARPAAVVEGRALEAAAHAGAVVALLLTVGSARYAALICTLWGIVLGVRALVPGERRSVRHTLVVAAAAAQAGAWWLLLAAGQVSVLEAYTVPAAGVALLAGVLARRSRPGLSSWVAYGPALAAGLLPSAATVLVGEGQPVRRLVLGLAALAVVLAGARARLQAPVVTGGGVLVLVALHEVVLAWDLLPRWIPLALAGLLLVGLAMTVERRRRDLARMRAAITRMT